MRGPEDVEEVVWFGLLFGSVVDLFRLTLVIRLKHTSHFFFYLFLLLLLLILPLSLFILKKSTFFRRSVLNSMSEWIYVTLRLDLA